MVYFIASLLVVGLVYVFVLVYFLLVVMSSWLSIQVESTVWIVITEITLCVMVHHSHAGHTVIFYDMIVNSYRLCLMFNYVFVSVSSCLK